MPLPRTCRHRAWILIAVSGMAMSSARAAFLFDGFLVPSFADASNTEYSAWDVMYAPYNLANYPDVNAPNGAYATASVAGFPTNSNYFPTDPGAYWNVNNPTITQTGPPSTFIIGPAFTGNIYSFSAPTSFVLADTTPYALGTAVFQFQTAGSFLDFSSIVLRYTDGTGTHDLAANETLREFDGSGSSMGGFANRAALQWNLTGLNITSYQILFRSTSASSSFQMASLDTSATYAAVVPTSGFYTAAGASNWSTSTSWQNSALPQDNANARFLNTGATTVTLDSSRLIGELRFESASNVTINASGGSSLTTNTGITTTGEATGMYTINAGLTLGEINFFDIEAGTVAVNGVVSGNHGLVKSGSGTLILSQNNTFGSSGGALEVDGGTLKLAGRNVYTDSTTALFGNLIIAANAPSGAPGAPGNPDSNVALGADSTTFANVGGGSAQITIEGDFNIGRSITLANGTFQKTLAAQGTTNGATYSGTIDLNTSSVMGLHTAAASDKVFFSGAIVNGATNGTLTVDGPGTFVFSGAAKSYFSATNVAAGTLQIASGTAVTGDGNFTVSGGGTLLVQGSLSGSGTLAANGGTVGGTGTISRNLSLNTGGVLSPGASGIGMLMTAAGETWGGGATLKLEINAITGTAGSAWDAIKSAGAFSITASSGSKFKLELDSLVGSQSGLLSGFNQDANYTWQFLISDTAITGFSASSFGVDTSHFLNPFSGSFSVIMGGDGKSLSVMYIPEPSSAALLLTAASFLGATRRRRRAVATR